MNGSDKIITAIIDDDEEFVFSLKEHLGFFQEIELLGTASKYTQAKNLLLKDNLDLVFMEIEMPVKSGFELIEEVRKSKEQPFSVIFCTSSDKYVVQALRESALDYLLKPIKPEEIKSAIRRFISNRKSEGQSNFAYVFHGASEIISLPTPTGLRFIEKNHLTLFQCTREQLSEKPTWKAMLTDFSEVKLRNGITAKELMILMGKRNFIQVNQSAILNLNFLASIEFKTRECLLIPPFSGIKVTASRTHLYDLRSQYDTL